MQRRKFLKASGIFAAGIYATPFKGIAGPFLPFELGHNIPVDKKLDPKWVKSLYNRGFVTKYLKSKNELQYIGMPVGGVNTGTLYLGGDGRLWLWDIFNDNREGIEPKEVEYDAQILGEKRKVKSRDGSAYIKPAKNGNNVEQGFAFQITIGDKTIIKKMETADWDDIAFEATYPMAKIHYIDKQLPLEITADVYSPFIALDDKNSSIPTTIYSFSFKNNSNQPISVSIIGWLENKVCGYSAKEADVRVNTALSGSYVGVEAGMKNPTAIQTELADYGTMCIAALDINAKAQTQFSLPVTEESFVRVSTSSTEKGAKDKLIGAVTTSLVVKPKSVAQSQFVIAWHFKNLRIGGTIEGDKGRNYNNWFKSSKEVVQYVNQNYKDLSSTSSLWKETWHDSTLPWWFLERTFLNTSTLATTTAHRFETGRFYAWEGVGCCPGTCSHVWQYAHAMGRIFPSLEKDVRERTDLGFALQPDGMIWYRGEMAKSPAIDGQAGTILRILREHQMSSDSTFLKKNWDKIKRATQYVINQDRNQDGMEDTPLENTLDAVWDGEIAWLVGLCIAAVKAGEMMAIEMNDTAFAAICADYVAKGRKNMEKELFNGEYFIHRPDAIKGREKLGSYNTSHIDQVFGQSWAHQVGLGRVLDKDKTMSALRSLWKYNFTPDVGPYIKEHTGGRPYALAGEGGMIMNTNPKNEAKPYGDNQTWQLGYFHECMSGFEHQVAAHMMAEGMIDEALVMTRMIHDRYHAAKRNPFNEIECSDHYARAMASYGTFISACGYEYHGPKGYMKFAPKLTPENFKAPFTAAEGWGSFIQQKKGKNHKAEIQVKYGKLQLKTVVLETTFAVSSVRVTHKGKAVSATFSQKENDCVIQLQDKTVIATNEKLIVTIA